MDMGIAIMPKVLIVDDYAIVRAGIKETLQRITGIEFEEASTGAEALVKLETSNWDVLLLDINLPDMNGVELTREIKVRKPDQKILVLSAQSAEKYALLMIRAGAHGYVSKDVLGDELVKAVKMVCSGERYINNELALLLIDGEKFESAPHLLLSPRETEIFSHICRGRRSVWMAQELGLSPKTISTYKARILQKMNMKSPSDLIYYAIKEGLIQQDEIEYLNPEQLDDDCQETV